MADEILGEPLTLTWFFALEPRVLGPQPRELRLFRRHSLAARMVQLASRGRVDLVAQGLLADAKLLAECPSTHPFPDALDRQIPEFWRVGSLRYLHRLPFLV